MIENILKNTTKLVSQFLEFKCIFYDLYKLGLCCCGTTDNPRVADSPPGMNTCAGAFCWDEHWHQRTVRENDGPSGKMTNSSGVKTLEMIHRPSGLQIECGLFLWLTSDVESFYKRWMCHACVVGRPSTKNGEYHHGRPWSSWGNLPGLGRMKMEAMGVLTMPWGSSK